MEVIEQIVTIYKNYAYTTEVLVASVRHPLHVVQAAMLGADIVTMPFKVIDQLVKHPLTDIYQVQKFLADLEIGREVPRAGTQARSRDSVSAEKPNSSQKVPVGK